MSWKRMPLILFGLLLFSSCASKKRINDPFLWKVSNNKQVIYFLGTLPTGAKLKDFPDSMKDLIRSADIIAVEASIETREKLKSELTKWFEKNYGETKSIYPKLKESFSPKAWEGLLFTMQNKEAIRFVRDQGITHPMTELHPTLIYEMILHLIKQHETAAFPPDVLLSVESHWHSLSFRKNTDYLLESEIEKIALKEQIPVMSLDNVEQVVYSVVNKANDPFVVSLESLYNPGHRPVDDAEKLRKIEDHYISGNQNKLLPLLEENTNDDFIHNKNKIWFEKLSSMNAKKIFVSIGVIHLIHQRNIMNLFLEKGYSLKRLSIQKLNREAN